MFRWCFLLLFLVTLALSFPLQAQQVAFVPSAQQEHLLAAMQQYQKIVESQEWVSFPGDVCVKPGTVDKLVPRLRKMLCLTQDLAQCSAADSSLFDEPLTAAVKRFQKRHGLAPDGVVGCQTLTAMNVSPAQRLRQIQLNLARWQDTTYMQPAGTPLVVVNIPDFLLQVINQHGQTVWSTPVIVGQPQKMYQTVPLHSKISYLVVRPTWNLPKSIIQREIIPAIRRDATYLAKNNMRLYTEVKGHLVPIGVKQVNWKTVDGRKLTIIQSPGPKNALGQLKFIFANPHDIYLHDTPVRSLFKHPVRTYSHGCVRVQNPEKLASFLLSPDWNKPRPFSLAHDTRVNENVFLPKPVSIQIRYFTCWVDGQGILQFREDVYGLDQSVLDLATLE
ncbi:L,D-transpeptidase family protein [Nibribacter ruber]|uniref:L,D-transpeptidase family protein n=1 Tax=Nibribacter ruber TaxID=2698458 RepID=A0A6P1NUS5_9BACT|nr:L,D-transpeptidase family protein [Nibribacter ruber]QHL86019.1 L,D-transpeptidase family protein [Nibribacter ruber]